MHLSCHLRSCCCQAEGANRGSTALSVEALLAPVGPYKLPLLWASCTDVYWHVAYIAFVVCLIVHATQTVDHAHCLHVHSQRMFLVLPLHASSSRSSLLLAMSDAKCQNEPYLPMHVFTQCG